jgi:transposase
MEKIEKIWLTDDAVWIRTADGREACEKFADYPRLRYATQEQRANYEADEYGLHWEDIDEDLSFEGFFDKRETTQLYKVFMAHPELNVSAIAGRFGFDKPIVVADSGLLSKANIEELTKDGYQYIIGARPKNETEAVRQQILAMNMKYGDVTEIRKDGGVRLVLSCTEKRAKKDAHNRKRGLARLEKKVAKGKLTKQHINNRGYNKYLKMEGEVSISIDMAKYEADAAWDGIKGYVTNTGLSKDDVIGNYGNLWFIERAFRMNKFDLAVRPIYHRLRNRIEGHICICFTAYTVMLELERILKTAKSEITIYRAQELTKNMYAITYALPRSKQVKRAYLGMDEEQSELCRLAVPGWGQNT